MIAHMLSLEFSVCTFFFFTLSSFQTEFQSLKYLFFVVISCFSREPIDICSSPGQCGGDHKGAEEWRSSFGLQGKRWHDCSSQSCEVEEPDYTRGEGSSPFICLALAYLCIAGFLCVRSPMKV